MGPHSRQLRAAAPGPDAGQAVDQVVRMGNILKQLRAMKVPGLAYEPPRIGIKFHILTWKENGETQRAAEDDLKKMADFAERKWLAGHGTHDALIVEHSAYSVEGPNTGQPANLGWPGHYPMEALCSICHQVVERKTMDAGQLDWKHTGRMPGDPR